MELMVVMAIIAAITGIALTSQSAFNKSLIVANTAYDIALSLRNAETYGLSSRVRGVIANSGYGLHFSRATPTEFTLFADTYPVPSSSSVCHPASDPTAPSALPGDCAYEVAQGEKVLTYSLGNGVIIDNFCAYVSGVWQCAATNGNTLATLDIVFSRPNPDSFISPNGIYSSASPASAACISVTSPQGGNHYVSIGASGSVTADALSCP